MCSKTIRSFFDRNLKIIVTCLMLQIHRLGFYGQQHLHSTSPGHSKTCNTILLQVQYTDFVRKDETTMLISDSYGVGVKSAWDNVVGWCESGGYASSGVDKTILHRRKSKRLHFGGNFKSGEWQKFDTAILTIQFSVPSSKLGADRNLPVEQSYCEERHFIFDE